MKIKMKNQDEQNQYKQGKPTTRYQQQAWPLM